MKGQVSVEFVSLLAISLVVSSILISGVNEKHSGLMNRTESSRAEQLALKTNYALEHVISEGNVERELEFSSELERNYTINVTEGEIRVGYRNHTESVRTAYEGEGFVLNSKSSYTISYDGGVVVE